MEHQAELVRVLVVDDEPSIVDVISMALRHHGFGVEAAATGKQALDQVRRWRPHVMVLDVMLPDMEGFEVARRLSAEHADVPILFLSARDATADKVRGLTTGGDDYVTKPIEVTVRADDERAVLEVRDHGPGLPADAGDRVFERFWRTEGAEPAVVAEPVSAWRSSRRSCKPTTAKCTRATPPMAGRCSR